MNTIKKEPATIDVKGKKTITEPQFYYGGGKIREDNIIFIPVIPQIDNPMAVIQYIRQYPINADYFNYLKELTTLSDLTISDWFHISPKTLAAYRSKDGTPKENTQEQLLMLIALYKHAEEVFDSREDFDNWLVTENFYFDNKKPLENLGTISGIKYINDRLTAMEYGDNI